MWSECAAATLSYDEGMEDGGMHQGAADIPGFDAGSRYTGPRVEADFARSCLFEVVVCA